jgi:hypothetical protein
VNLAELHQVNASCKFRSKCLEQLAESLSVRASVCVFGRVPACSAESLDGLLTRSVEIILANVKQTPCLTLRILKSLYPLTDFNAVSDGSDLVSTLQLLISNVFTLLLISVVSYMSEFFLNHIRKIRPPSEFM